jgi:glycosyltransferase involved in cell wall biosynthesis
MIFCQYPVLLASLVGLILSRVWGSSLVLDVPDLWPEAFAMTGSVFARPASFIARPLAFAVYKRADYVTTFGEFAKKSIASYGADESKIMSVFGGVDLEVFRPMDKIAAASSIKVQQLTEIFRSFVVMYIGTISRVYDIAILVKLAKQLENCPDLVVVVMGEGEAKSEILQEQSRRRLRNLIILPSVRDHSLVPYIINLADVCVIPLGSSLDPLANMAYKSEVSTKLFEYCACGKPVICLGRGEQGDIVTRSNAGEVFDAKDLAGLTNAILHLRSDRARLEQYARNSRALAEGLFSIENTAKRLESVVQQVMRGNRTTG